MEVNRFVVLRPLAARFWQDCRRGLRSKEQGGDRRGVTRSDPARELTAPAAPSVALAAPVADGEPPRGRAVREQPYPTLAFIATALGASDALIASPEAPALEARARQLVAEYWSDSAWTTGVVPEAAFRRVLAELAPNLLDRDGLVELDRDLAPADGRWPAPQGSDDAPQPRAAFAAA